MDEDDFEVVQRPTRKRDAPCAQPVHAPKAAHVGEYDYCEVEQEVSDDEPRDKSAPGGTPAVSRVLEVRRALGAAQAALHGQQAEVSDERRMLAPLVAQRRAILSELRCAYTAYEDAAHGFTERTKDETEALDAAGPDLVKLLNAVLGLVEEWRVHETRHALPGDTRNLLSQCTSSEALLPMLRQALAWHVARRDTSQSMDASIRSFSKLVHACDASIVQQAINQFQLENLNKD